jgi:hypothetical protein
LDELLLDTTYLLPVFGVGTDLKRFADVFPRLLKGYSVVYQPLSLVEAKWVIFRLAKTAGVPREELFLSYRRGLRTLQNETRMRPSQLTDDSVEELADSLLVQENIVDYFDRMMFATATVRGSILLTEDETLHELASRRGSDGTFRAKRWSEVPGLSG